MSITLYSQNFEVKGKVWDLHNNQPLSNTSIYINEKQVTHTDKEGKFSISLPANNYQIKAIHEGCDEYNTTIIVNKNLFINIYLEHHAQEIEQVRITKTTRNKNTPNIDKKSIEKNSYKNLGNTLNQISGINILQTGNNITKPVINGLYGSRILMMNHGVKMSEQEWGVEHSPSIDPNIFEQISIVKGAKTLKYGGDAVGGIISLEPRYFPIKDSIYGKVIATGISSGRGGNLTMDINKTWKNNFFVNAQGSYKKLGDLYTPHATLQNTGNVENAFSLNFGNKSFEKGIEVFYSGMHQNFGIFKGSHLESPFDFYNSINFGQGLYTGNFSYNIDNPKQEVSHHLVKVEGYKRFPKIGKFMFQYAFQQNDRKEFDIRRGDLNNLPSMDLRLTTHSFKIENLIEREKWQLESGISGAQQNNFPDPSTKAKRLIPDYDKYDVGIFSILQHKLNSSFNFEAGVRYDFNHYDSYKYYDEKLWNSKYQNQFPEFFVQKLGTRILTHPKIDYHNFSANLGLSFKPDKNTDIRLNFARISRTPNPAELFADGLHHSAAIVELGDLSLKNEVVHRINFDVYHHFDFLEGWSFNLSPYFMFSDKFINQIPTGVQQSNRGIFTVWEYQQIKAKLLGIDAETFININKNISWKMQFSYVYGYDRSSNEYLILMPPMNIKNSLEFTIPKLPNAYLSIENVQVMKQNLFPIHNINIEMIENGSFVEKELDISSTPKAYNIWNLNAGIDLTKNFGVMFSISNLLNKEYREYLNRLRYFSYAQGRNVTLSLKYNF